MADSIWQQDAWRAREDEEREEVTLHIINRKLNHLLSGVASILEAQTSIIEGQLSMEEGLQPVLDAINALATEEGDVAVAVKSIVDKVNNGQVVVKQDAQQLVDAINSVTDGLKQVVASTSGTGSPSQTTPIEPPALPASEQPPVPTTIQPPTAADSVPVTSSASAEVSSEPIPASTPVSPPEAPAGSPVTTDGGVPAPDGSNLLSQQEPPPLSSVTSEPPMTEAERLAQSPVTQSPTKADTEASA